MTLKKRLDQLEFLQNEFKVMPEGLSPQQQYFFLLNQKSPNLKQIVPCTLTPEQAYAELMGGSL